MVYQLNSMKRESFIEVCTIWVHSTSISRQYLQVVIQQI